MTLSLKKLIDAVHEAATSSAGVVDETKSEVRCSGRWVSNALFDQWSGIQAAVPVPWLNLCLRDAGGVDLDLSSWSFEEIEGQAFSIVLQKVVPEGVFAFLTVGGFRNGLQDAVVEKAARVVYVMGEFAPFASGACAFLPLSDECDFAAALAIHAGALVGDEVEAARLTRYMTLRRRPPRLAFWVEKQPPSMPSDVSDVWRAEAVKSLLLVPVNEIWEGEGGLCVGLSGLKAGPKKRTLSVGEEALVGAECFAALNDAVSWLIEVPREAAVRHVYLTAELAREWPSDVPEWARGLAGQLKLALEGARTHYEAYLLETSSEMLKSLADLRKAVSEETGRAIARTQSLLTALAGSLAAALGVLLLRVPALISTKTPEVDRTISQYVFGILAVWMVFICAFSLVTNWKFRAAMDAGRNNWHKKIHAVLSTTEFDEIATGPLRKAEKVYNVAAWVVAAVYGIAALSLAVLATDPFERTMPQPRSESRASSLPPERASAQVVAPSLQEGGHIVEPSPRLQHGLSSSLEEKDITSGENVAPVPSEAPPAKANPSN